MACLLSRQNVWLDLCAGLAMCGTETLAFESLPKRVSTRGNPKTPHFHWPALGQHDPPNPSHLSTGPGPARDPKSLTFIDRPWASPAPKPSLLLAKPSLLSTGPGPARPPTPHFYWPDPSLLSARPLASISQAWPPAGLRPKPFRGQLRHKESLGEQNRHRHPDLQVSLSQSDSSHQAVRVH